MCIYTYLSPYLFFLRHSKLIQYPIQTLTRGRAQHGWLKMSPPPTHGASALAGNVTVSQCVTSPIGRKLEARPG